MTVNVPLWVGVLYSFLLVGGAFGAAVAAFRTGNGKVEASAAEAQKNAIEAMRAQIDSQKDAADADRAKIAALEAKVNALETFNGQLAGLLTGRPDWDSIRAAVFANTALSEKIAKHLGVE